MAQYTGTIEGGSGGGMMQLSVGIVSDLDVQFIDVVISSFSYRDGTSHIHNPEFKAKTLHSTRIPWPEDVQKRLRDAMDVDGDGGGETKELSDLNFVVGRELAQAVLQALDEAGLSADRISSIGSYGQLIWCDVDDENSRTMSVLSLGEPALISEITGCSVVADFPSSLVILGDAAVPLCAVFDGAVFRPKTSGKWRAVQHLDKHMSVVTLLTNEAEEDKSQLVSFHTGPGIGVIDFAVEQARKNSDGANAAEQDLSAAKWAQKGKVSNKLLDTMLQHPFLLRKPPRTTGVNTFGTDLVATWASAAKEGGLTDADFVATTYDFLARALANAYALACPNPSLLTEVLLSGCITGDRHLISRMRYHLKQVLKHDVSIRPLSKDTDACAAESKGACEAAFLGFLAMNGLKASVVSPACPARILGKVSFGPAALTVPVSALGGGGVALGAGGASAFVPVTSVTSASSASSASSVGSGVSGGGSGRTEDDVSPREKNSLHVRKSRTDKLKKHHRKRSLNPLSTSPKPVPEGVKEGGGFYFFFLLFFVSSSLFARLFFFCVCFLRFFIFLCPLSCFLLFVSFLFLFLFAFCYSFFPRFVSSFFFPSWKSVGRRRNLCLSFLFVIFITMILFLFSSSSFPFRSSSSSLARRTE